MNPYSSKDRPAGQDVLPTKADIAPAKLESQAQPLTPANFEADSLESQLPLLNVEAQTKVTPAPFDYDENYRGHSGKRLLIAAFALVAFISASGFGLAAYVEHASKPKPAGSDLSNINLKEPLSADTQNHSLHINYDTLVEDGKTLTANGAVIVQNDQTAGFSVQGASGSQLLVADTSGSKVGVGQAPTGSARLQVNGSISVNGSILSSGGGYSLDARGLSLGGVLVCTVSGCTNQTVDLSPFARLAGNNSFSGINKFTSSGNVFSGDGSGLSALNAGNISSGTLSDNRLSGNVALVGNNNSFTGANSFTAQIQASGGVNATAYSISGTAGAAIACGPGEVLQQASISGGIVTGGICVAIAGGTTPTLQQVYDVSSPAHIVLSTANGAVQIQDAAPALGANLFEVTNNGGGTKYFAVSAGGISITGNVNTTGQYQVNGSQISSGNLSDSASLTKQGNSFNGANQLTQLNASSELPAVSGTNLTNLNAGNVSSGTLNDLRLSANVTKQGNAFNGANQLVQLTAGGILPVLNGSNLTALNAGNITSGTLSDARLSTNVALLSADNIFLGDNSYHLKTKALAVQDAATPLGTNLFEVDNNDGSTKYFTVSATALQFLGKDVCTTAGNCTGVSGGSIGGSGTAGKIAKFTGSGFTIGDSLLSESGSVVAVGGSINIASGNTYQINGSQISSADLSDSASITKQGNTFNGASQLVQLNGSTQLPAVSGTNLTNLNASNVSSGTLDNNRLNSDVALTDRAGGQTFTTAQTFNNAITAPGLTTVGASLGIGSSTASLSLTGDLSSTAAVTNGTNTTTIGFAGVPAGDIHYNFDVSAAAGTYTICTTANAASCVGGANGVTTSSSGTNGTIAMFTGSQTIANSIITQSGTTISVGGTLNAATLQQGGTGVLLTSTSFSGDASGTYNAISVDKLKGTALSISTLSDTNFLVYNSTSGNWENHSFSGDITVDHTGAATIGVGKVTSSNIADGTITNADVSGTAGIAYSKLNLSGSITNSDVSSSAAIDYSKLNLNASIKDSDVSASSHFAFTNTANAFTGNNTFTLNTAGLAVQDAATPLGTNLFEVDNNDGSTKYFTVSATALQFLGKDVCTTAGNCTGVSGGSIGGSGTAGKIAKFTGSGFTIGDSLISDNGSTVTVGGTLAVNTISPTATLTVGVATQTLTLQGDASTSLSATSGSFTNSLVFAAPAVSSKTITIPNASGTVAVSASGPLSLDAAGNLTCPTCLTSGGGGSGGVSHINSLNGDITLAGTASQIIITPSGNTLTFSTPQNIDTTSSPTFANINVSSGGLYEINSVQISSSALSNDSNLAKLGGTQTFTGANTFNNASNSFTGDGSGLTNLNASNVSSGTLNDGRLSSNVALLNRAGQVFTGDNTIKLDSGAALQIQNSGGTSLFNANTTDSYVINNGTVAANNLLQNPGFEAGGTTAATGWSLAGNAAITSNSANARTGSDELVITADGTANNSAQTAGYYAVTPGDLYDVSVWVKSAAGTNGTAETIFAYYKGDKTLLSAGFCSYAPPGTTYVQEDCSGTIPANAAYMQVLFAPQAGSTTGTWYFDDAYMASGSYHSPIIFQNTSNSAAAFQVQSSNSADTLLTVDTTARNAGGGNLVKIGNSTGTDTNTTILVVDSASSVPTSNLGALNGGLFYNSATNHLSVIENGVVKELCNKTDLGCGSSAPATTLAGSYANGSSQTDETLLLDSTRSGVLIRDNATPIGSTLFGVQNSTGGTKYLDVTTSGIAVTGTITASGNINSSSGTIQTGGTDRIDNSGNLTNIGTINGNTFNNAGNLTFGNSGSAAVNAASGQDLNLGTGASAHTTTLGSTTGAATTIVQAGTGGISLNGNVTVAGTNTFTVNGGNTSLGANLDVTSSVAFKHGIDVSATPSLDDLNVGNVSLVRLSGASTQTLTGIAGGRDGYILTIINAAGQAAIIANDNAASAAANRILTGTGANISLPVNGSITLVYDSQASRWRVIGDVNGGSGSGVTAVGTFTSCTSYANGAQISGGTITFSCADASNPGLVSTGAQTWGGAKSFNALLTGNAGLTVSGGAVSLTGNAASSLTTTAGALSLQGAGGVNLTTADTASGSSSNITIASGNVTAGAGASGNISVDTGTSTGTTGTVSIGTANASAVSIGLSGKTTTVNGALTVSQAVTANGGITVGANKDISFTAGAGNFDQSSSTGTFATGSGNVSLNGAATVTGSNNFTVNGGNTSLGGNLDVTGSVAFKHGVDVSAAPSLDDLNVGNVSLVRLTGASTQTLTGIAGGRDGYVITVVNAAAQNAVLANDNAASAAANRILTGTGGNVSLPVNGSITLVYDSQAARWRVIGDVNGGSGAGVTTVGTLNSQTKSADGAVIAGNSIVLQTADASFAGLVSTGTQTFAGAKTFTGNTNIELTSSSAFQVQNNSAADTLLTVDTTARSASGGNLVKIGNSTGTDTDTTILVLDSASAAPTSNLSVLNGGLYYNTSTNHINIIENGQVKELCNKTDLGCGTSAPATTLAGSYANGTSQTDETIALDSTRNGVLIRDNATPIGSTLFGVQNSTGGTKYLDVTASGIAVSGSVTASGNINTSGGTIQTNNVTRIDNSGNLTSIGNFTASAGTTFQTTGANGFTFKPGTDNTTAFQIQNANSGSLLAIDSLNSNITINGLNSGALQSWSTTSAISARYGNSVVAANGYLYSIDGGDASINATSIVQYAKINANGTVGTWNTTNNTNLPATIEGGAVVVNGYIYYIGGSTTNNGNGTSTVSYARIKSDGTLSNWTTATPMTNGKMQFGLAAYNGYIYATGGYTNTGTITSLGYYAKPNADGSITSWNSVNLPASRDQHASIAANGYLYVVGGITAASNPNFNNDVLYAPIASNGSVGAWTATNPAGAPVIGQESLAVSNGYIYTLNGSNTAPLSAVSYAPLNSNGSTGSWTTQSNPTGLSATFFQGAAAYNGYFYIVGGYNAGTQSAVQYTSGSRVQVGGSLDLVGANGGQTLSDNFGGSLTAGNTNIVGNLQVQGPASLNQNVTIGGNLNAGGQALFQNSTDSTTAFQVQNASGTSLLTADTANTRLTLNADTTVGQYNAQSYFSDNFESGTLGFWTTNNNSTSIQSGTVHNGNYALSFSPPGSATWLGSNLGASSTAYLRAWVDLTSQSSSTLRFMGLDNGTGNGWTWNVYRNNTGQVCINNTGASTTNCGGSMSIGAWHLVELQITMATTTTGTTNLWLDGTNVYSSTTDNNGTAGKIQNLYVGDNTGSETGTGFIDDVSVGNSRSSTAASLNVDDTLTVGGNTNLNGQLVVKAAVDGTNFRVLNSAGNSRFSVSTGSGNGTYMNGLTSINTTSTVIMPPSDTAYAFQIQDAGGLNMFNVDTTGTGTISVNAATTSVGAFNAANTSFPTTGILDNFNRANAGPPPSSNWSQGPFDFTAGEGLQLSSNAVIRNAAGSFRQDDYWNPTTFGPDSEVYATISTKGASDSVGLYLRGTSIASGTSDGYYLNIGEAAGAWNIQRLTNGVGTGIGNTVTQVISNGDAVGFSARGNVLTAWYKPSGGAWKVVAQATDSTYTTAGNIGIGIGGTSGTVFDDFGGGNSRSGFSVNSNGNLTSRNITDSTTAFQVQNAAGTNILAVDSTNQRVSIGASGTATGQLYIGGAVPSAVLGSSSTGLTGPNNVYVQGKYAYVADNGKLAIFDVSNPAAPVSIGSSTTNLSGFTYVYVQGRYAYMVSYTGNNLVIFDVSNPAAPVSVGSAGGLSSPRNVYVQGRYAYVSSYNNNQLAIFDISNPANPVLIGTTSTGLTGPGFVYVQGRYAYVIDNTQLAIFDVSNPAAPVSKGTTTSGLSGPQRVYVSGRYAYVTSATNNTLAIFDISNPASPSLAGSSTTGLGSPSGVYVQGRYAYVANTGNSNLSIFDISNPASPVSVGSISTGLNTAEDVYVQGRYAYVASFGNTSLVTFDLGGTYSQQLEAGGAKFGTLSVDSNAVFAGDANIQGGLSVGGGIQSSGNLGVSGGATVQGGTYLSGGSNGLSSVSISNIVRTSCNGTTTYFYTVTAVDAYGGETAWLGSIGNFNSFCNPLSGTNYLTISWNAVSGATAYKVYRTTSTGTGASGTVGYLGTTTGTSYNDIGASASGVLPKTIDTTRQLAVSGSSIFQTPTNTTSAFQVQNSSVNTILNVDSTNNRVNIDTYITRAISAPTQNAPSTSTTGGLLTAATYYYKITAIDSMGGETTSSAEQSIVTTGTTSTVTLSWVPIYKASGYKIYRSTSSGAEVYLTTTMGTVNGSNLNYVDKGTITLGSATPPATGTAMYTLTNTQSKNQLQVGDVGTPTGQVYVGGSLPWDVTNGGVPTITKPQAVYVLGKYAYVVSAAGASDKLQIFDVSNPAAPVDVSNGGVAITSSSYNVYAQGHYVYLAGSSTNKLQIFDVSNPSSPVDVSSGGVATASSPDALYVQGRYAYVGSLVGNTLQVYDVANPSSPSLVGSVSTGAIHVIYVYVQGRYAYVVGSNTGKLIIFDVSNPSSPVDASSGGVATQGAPSSVYVQGRYAYIVGSANKLQIFDVSNPAAVTDVTGGGVSTTTGVYMVYVQGRYAYVTASSGKLQVFDISNPVSPTDVSLGGVTAGTTPTGLFVSGRYAYVTNYGSNNMQIFDLGGTYSQQLEAGGAEIGTLQVDSNGQVAGDFNIQGGLNVGQSLQTAGNVGIGGGLNAQGSVILGGGINQLAAPAAPTVTCQTSVSGCTSSITWGYIVTAINSTGGETNLSATGQITASDGSNLSSSTYNHLTWTAVSGATGYKIYRTIVSGGGSPTPNSVGLIGSTTGTTFDDTGLVATGSVPTVNTTAQLTVQGSVLFQNKTNSTTAFQIQNAAGTSNLFVADTTNSRIGIGTATPSYTLDVSANSSATSGNQVGARVLLSINPSSASTATYFGTSSISYSGSANLSGASVYGIDGEVQSNSGGNIGTAVGGKFNASTLLGTIQNAIGVQAINNFIAGTINNSAGVNIYNQTGASNNTNLLIGTSTVPTGNYSIYNSSSYANYFGGATTIQTTGSNSPTAFQVQNSTGASIFNVDTQNGLVGTAGTSTASTNSNNLTIQSGNATGTTSNSGNVSLDSGSATGTVGTVSIANTNANTVNVAANNIGHTINIGSGASSNFPQTPVLDNFNRANSTGLGANWTAVTGFNLHDVNSNEAHDSNVPFAWSYWNPSTFGPNSEAYATIATANTNTLRVCVRFDPVNKNGYCVSANNDSWSIIREDSGTATTLGATFPVNSFVGDKLGIRITGTSPALIEAWYYSSANSAWYNLASRTDSTYSAANYLAVESQATDFDDFGGGTISGTFNNSQNIVVGSNNSMSGITLQGGSGNINLASAGSVIVKPVLDTATAFQIQNSSATSSLLVADTVQDVIGIGGAPTNTSSPLQVINSTQSINVGTTPGGGIGINFNNVNSTKNTFIHLLSSASGGLAFCASTTSTACSSGQDQVQLSGGGAIAFRNTANSSTAFQIQNANNADQLFTVNTNTRTGVAAGNTIKVGNSTSSTDADTTVLIADGYAGTLTTNLASLNGGIYYNSSTNHLNVIENGVVKELCNKTDLGCSATGPTITLSQAYQNGASQTDSTITFDSTRKGLILQDAAATVGNLFTIQANSSNGSSQYLNVSSSRISLNEGTDVTGGLATPTGGFGTYSNLLKQSEGFDITSSWTYTNVTTPLSNTDVDPTGNTGAESLADSASGGSASQTFATTAVGNYTFSVWLKTASGTQNVDLRVDSTGTNGQTGTVKTVTATPSWQRFFVTQNFTGPTITGVVVNIFPGGTAGSGTVSAWGAQLVTGTLPQVYITTGSSNVSAVSRGLSVNGNSVFKPTSDNTTSFQVQNAAGSAIFNVDTSTSAVSVSSTTVNLGTNLAGHNINIGSGQSGFTVADNFNRANGTLQNNTASGGGTWSNLAISGSGSNLTISGNSVTGSSAAAYNNNYLSTIYGPDSEAYATIATVGNSGTNEVAALYLRLNNPGIVSSTGYELNVLANGTWQFWRMNSGGSFVTLGGTFSQAISAGDMFGFRVTGTSSPVLEAWYKSASGTWTRLSTYTDPSPGSSFTSAGNVALEVYGTAPRIDDLRAGNAGTQAVTVGSLSASSSLNLQSGTGNLTLSSAGSTTVKAGVDSTTAFQIQNASGNNLFTADTTNNRVVISTASTAGNDLLRLTANSVNRLQVDDWGDLTSTIRNNAGTEKGTISLTTYGGSDLSINFDSPSSTNKARIHQTAAGALNICTATSGQSCPASDQFSLAANGALILQNSTNSTTAFQVQNASGSTTLSVDTTALNGLLTNSNFESSSVSSWVYSGSAGGSTSRTTSQAYLGSASLAVTSGTTAAATDGVKYTVGTSLSASTTYTLSFYALLGSGTMSNLGVTYSPDGGTTNYTCLSGSAVSTSGWTRYSCSFNSTQSAVNPNSSAYFLITNGDTTTRTFYIDAVQLEAASSATAYKETGISLNGLINSAVSLQNASNSTTAFQVQNAAGTSLFTVDTTNNQIVLGLPSANPVLLVLGTKNTAGDPTCTNGAIYYNSNSAQFRGCAGGSWVTLSGSLSTPQSVRVTNSTSISLSNTTDTLLGFDTEDYDSNSLHSTVSNTDRLTAPVSGKYHIYGNIMVDTSSYSSYMGRIKVWIVKNGTTTIATNSTPLINFNSLKTLAAVETTVNLSSSDYVQIYAEYENCSDTWCTTSPFGSTAPSSLNIVSSSDTTPIFGMDKISD